MIGQPAPCALNRWTSAATAAAAPSRATASSRSTAHGSSGLAKTGPVVVRACPAVVSARRAAESRCRAARARAAARLRRPNASSARRPREGCVRRQHRRSAGDNEPCPQVPEESWPRLSCAGISARPWMPGLQLTLVRRIGAGCLPDRGYRPAPVAHPRRLAIAPVVAKRYRLFGHRRTERLAAVGAGRVPVACGSSGRTARGLGYPCRPRRGPR